MVVCFFGYPNDSYSRSKILIDGLKKNGIKVVSCTDKTGFALLRYWKLTHKFLRVHKKCDLIFVQFPGQLNMPIAWILGKLFSKQVILDAFVSLYNTYVFDRRSVKQASFAAKFYWWVDKLSCTLAHKVTLDTNAHIDYFVKTFRLRRKKFFRLPVGGDDTVFRPKSKVTSPRKASQRDKQRSKVIIEFHGMFTRLHGAEYFVRVAKKLEHHKNFEFWLIGDSWNYRLPIDLYYKLKPKTTKYWPRLSVKKLAKKTAASDILVGHLGSTQKARMVVTNKMYQALASRVALIAPDCKATREFLQDRQNCLMVKMHHQEDLAKKIIQLAQNHQLRRKLAQNGYKLYRQRFTNKHIGERLKRIISS